MNICLARNTTRNRMQCLHDSGSRFARRWTISKPRPPFAPVISNAISKKRRIWMLTNCSWRFSSSFHPTRGDIGWQLLKTMALHSRGWRSQGFVVGFTFRNLTASTLRKKGMETIRRHCEDFIRTRPAPANPPNDGKQTPMRGHLVFIAQHATATCC